MARSVLNTNTNLLVALDALIDEGSVTKAAARIGVTQSSMSSSLAQLRDIFGDALLVRVGNTMQPTPLAERIRQDLKRGVKSFDAAFAGGADFDPRTSREQFVLALSDRVEAVLFVGLLERVRQAAPCVTLQVLPWGSLQQPPQLGTGEIDLSVGITVPESAIIGEWRGAPSDLAAGLHSSVLFDSRLASIVRANHPGVSGELTVEVFCGLEHVLVTEQLGADGIVDHVLSRIGKERRIAARVPRHTLVGDLIARTDLIATIDRRVAAMHAERYGLQLFEPPVELPIGNISMIWHKRTEQDAARRWLRKQVTDTAAEVELHSKLTR